MSEAQRRRQSLRLRSEALRQYRDGQYSESEATFREALEHVPRDVAAIEGMARATGQQSRFAEALAWANLAVERSPRSGAAYRVLGDVWRQAGHPDEAARVYRRGLFRAPTDRWLRQRLRDVQ
jgi:aspartate beta-hydroxylase